MHNMTKIILTAALLSLLTAGCYTKFYRPDMEQAGQGPYETLYDRNDSTAIDTTLTKPEGGASYPDDNSGWSDWGQSRRYTRWGFDFDNFEPNYYWTYYGYYDYYSRPWWDRYTDPWWNGGWGGPGTPAEPPSQRDFGRRDESIGGGNYTAPPPAPSGGSYTNPPPPPPDNGKNPPDASKKQEDTNKREGRRGR